MVLPAVVLVGCWTKLRWSGLAGVMLKGDEMTPVRVAELAQRV